MMAVLVLLPFFSAGQQAPAAAGVRSAEGNDIQMEPAIRTDRLVLSRLLTSDASVELLEFS